MVELAPRPAITLPTGRHGIQEGPAGVTIALVEGLSLVSIAARKGQAAALVAVIERGYGLSLPMTPHRVGGARQAFVWAGPEQWLALGTPGFAAALTADLDGLASVVDQSDGRVLLRLSGPRVREALAKGLAIDLHPRAFGPGQTAISQIAHVGVQIWQIADDAYEIAAFRGFAGTLIHALLEMSAEYGVDFNR
ncbi:sarcosine oxidase subunit gamma [Acetobacteraceae bacterium H6797]|nr:sarcosine oxidase subunit gamma [Acetobacteraceae bacterium H6797]